MPRFGHKGLLNEKQLQHLMALLLDPKSAVNQ
jgi:sulfur-oxidizing protein SoxX